LMLHQKSSRQSLCCSENKHDQPIQINNLFFSNGISFCSCPEINHGVISMALIPEMIDENTEVSLTTKGELEIYLPETDELEGEFFFFQCDIDWENECINSIEKMADAVWEKLESLGILTDTLVTDLLPEYIAEKREDFDCDMGEAGYRKTPTHMIPAGLR